MVVTAVAARIPADADMIGEELNETLNIRDYYRDFDVQDHKNAEAIAKAELDATLFQVKRFLYAAHVRAGDEYVDRIVAAVTKATIATARRMKREEELNRLERKIADLQRKAVAGA